jgi:hypothetical protein
LTYAEDGLFTQIQKAARETFDFENSQAVRDDCRRLLAEILEVYNPQRKEHLQGIIDILHRFFSKVTFDREVTIAAHKSAPVVHLYTLRRHIQDFFTFIEFID